MSLTYQVPRGDFTLEVLKESVLETEKFGMFIIM